MSRFIDNKDDTITDTKTNLMWQKETVKEMTFNAAQEFAKSLKLANYKDWRLPTIQELLTIVDYERYEPTIDPVFNCQSKGYWSGTTVAIYPYNAWNVYFNDGNADWSNKDYNNYVRCVRDFKKES